MNKKFYRDVQRIKSSARNFCVMNTAKKDKILFDLAKEINTCRKSILNANKKDLVNFSTKHPLYDRLVLTEERIDGIIVSIQSVIKLKDPIGEVLDKKVLKNKLKINRIRVPFGVIGVIYESRPNVTIEVASLCIKTGNAVILRGGKDADNTNTVFVKIIQKILIENKLPKDLVYLASSKDRSAVKNMMSMDDFIDVIIPRGGKGLINFVRQNSMVPVIETGAGVCHTYMESTADINKAVEIIYNAKTQRPSVCNALDTVVVDKKIINKLLPKLARRLLDKKVIIMADYLSYSKLKKYYPANLLKKSKASDYGKEFMSLKMSIKTVNGFEEGLDFVQIHTSGHSESIITKNSKLAEKFLSLVDAAAVYTNASTRYTDGFEFGLGAEIGISTQKLHARGPMGLDALTTYKWVIRGNGQIRK